MIALPNARNLLTRLAIALSLGVALTITVAAQSNQKTDGAIQTEPPVPKSTVKGRVIYDDTERPVRRSPVSLVQLPERGQLSSATDRDGRFVIRDVPAGHYFVLVDSPGIITPIAFLKINDKGPPASWNVKEIKEYCTEVIADGSTNVEVTVRAHRGAALSGKVTYDDGSVAVNAEVGVVRRNGKESVRVLTGTNAAALLSLHTDDRGLYRIAALPPGEYIISAAETNTSPDKTGRYRGDSFGEFFKSDALAISYYGGTNRLADAVSVRVEAGSEMTNLDITLPDMTPHAISGSVIAKLDGRILPGATLTVRNKDQAEWFLQGERQIQANTDGQWTLTGVPDGLYLISVEPPYDIPDPGASSTQPSDNEDESPAKPSAKRKFVRKEMELNVAGSDVGGIAIELAEGASISGVVEMPADSSGEGKGYVLIRYAYEGTDISDFRNSTGAYDGTFKIESLRAGNLYLSADVTTGGTRDDGSGKYYVKSITLNGSDLMRKPLTIEAGQSITNVKVVISADLARANLQFIDGQGKPISARPVAIVPIEPLRWSFQGASVQGMTDVKGMMPFAAAPGEYMVITAGANDSWPPSPELIRGRAQTATRIRLQPGDNKIVTIYLN